MAKTGAFTNTSQGGGGPFVGVELFAQIVLQPFLSIKNSCLRSGESSVAELDLETTPVEAGFGKMLKLDSGRTFPGSDILRNSQISKKLVGIELEGRRAARAGTRILFEGKDCGIVTSGAFSPSLSHAVAMGYIGAEIPDAPGTKLELSGEKFSIAGLVSPPPFYKKGTAKANIT